MNAEQITEAVDAAEKVGFNNDSKRCNKSKKSSNKCATTRSYGKDVHSEIQERARTQNTKRTRDRFEERYH